MFQETYGREIGQFGVKKVFFQWIWWVGVVLVVLSGISGCRSDQSSDDQTEGDTLQTEESETAAKQDTAAQAWFRLAQNACLTVNFNLCAEPDTGIEDPVQLASVAEVFELCQKDSVDSLIGSWAEPRVHLDPGSVSHEVPGFPNEAQVKSMVLEAMWLLKLANGPKQGCRQRLPFSETPLWNGERFLEQIRSKLKTVFVKANCSDKHFEEGEDPFINRDDSESVNICVDDLSMINIAVILAHWAQLQTVPHVVKPDEFAMPSGSPWVPSRGFFHPAGGKVSADIFWFDQGKAGAYNVLTTLSAWCVKIKT